MKKHDVVVIGAGLFGAATARLLAKQGYDVAVVDSNERFAASKCSFGVWKDGWVDKVKPYLAEGLDLLDEFCGGIETREFFDLGKEDVVHQFFYADCFKIMTLGPDITVYPHKVHTVQRKAVNLFNGDQITAKKAVIIAAGAYTDNILTQSGFKPRGIDIYWGATMNVNMHIDECRIFEWAPYKQSILHVLDENNFQFGDGSTVKNPKGDDPRLNKTSERLQLHMNDVVGINVPHEKIVDVREGYRPYIPKGQSFINHHGDRIYSATGGAKNSTLVCTYVAQELFKIIQDL